MRPGPAALALLLAFGFAAGCARHDNADVGQDLKNAGHDVSHEAGKVGRDPDVKAAESDLKAAGHDVATDLRKAGEQAKSAASDVAHDAGHAAHDVTNDARGDHQKTSDNDNS